MNSRQQLDELCALLIKKLMNESKNRMNNNKIAPVTSSQSQGEVELLESLLAVYDGTHKTRVMNDSSKSKSNSFFFEF